MRLRKVLELRPERRAVAAPAVDEEELGLATAGPLVVQLEPIELGVRHETAMVS